MLSAPTLAAAHFISQQKLGSISIDSTAADFEYSWYFVINQHLFIINSHLFIINWHSPNDNFEFATVYVLCVANSRLAFVSLVQLL